MAVTIMEFEYEEGKPGLVRVYAGSGEQRELVGTLPLNVKQARQLGAAIDRVVAPILKEAAKS